MKKVVFISLFLIPLLLQCNLSQIALDSMIAQWRKNYFAKLTIFEKEIIKKYIQKRARYIEAIDATLIPPLRKILFNADIQKIFLQSTVYYQLLMLPTLLDILVATFDAQWNFYSYTLQQAKQAVLQQESFLKKPYAIDVYRLFDEIDDYFLEHWYLLSEYIPIKKKISY